MRRVIIYLVLVILISACKTTKNIVNNVTGISIMLPSNAKISVAEDLNGKYSNELYQVHYDGYITKWDETYLMKDSIIVGFSSSNTHAFEKKKRRKELGYGAKYRAGEIYIPKEIKVHERDYLLFYYNKKNNNNDFFVRFYSDFTVKDQIWVLFVFLLRTLWI